MTILTRPISDEEVPDLLAAFERWLTPFVQCSTGSFWPSPTEIADAAVAIVAVIDDRPIGVALSTSHGHIGWLIADPQFTREALDALSAAVLTATGDAWGRVENDALREAYLSASPEVYRPDPDADPLLIRRQPCR